MTEEEKKTLYEELEHRFVSKEKWESFQEKYNNKVIEDNKQFTNLENGINNLIKLSENQNDLLAKQEKSLETIIHKPIKRTETFVNEIIKVCVSIIIGGGLTALLIMAK